MSADAFNPMPAMILLAQRGRESASIIYWSIGLIILVVVMVVLIAWLRKALNAPVQAETMGFTLSDLREMRKKGLMSEEEFERAKARIVQGIRPERGPEGKTGRTGPDHPSPPPQNPGSG